MGTLTYPKKGQKGSRPGAEVQPYTYTLRCVYWDRANIGKNPEQRMRELFLNEYGKRPMPERPMADADDSIPVSPSKTQLHGR
jgi:hypothetical protein